MDKQFQFFEFRHSLESLACDSDLQFPDSFSAYNYLSSGRHDPLNMMRMRDLLAEQELDVHRMDDHQILEQLTWCFVDRKNRITTRVPESSFIDNKSSTSAQAELTDEPTEQEIITPVPTPAVQVNTNWLKVQILDDETNQPLSNVSLNIKLPDGALKELKCDSEGIVELNDLTPGTFDIEQVIDTDALEIVSLD